MVTTAEVSDVNCITWTVSKVIQSQLAVHPAEELDNLLRLWSHAHEKDDAAELSLAVGERYEWPTAFVIDGIGFWRSVSISALPASA
jgi:hypothetical protein